MSDFLAMVDARDVVSDPSEPTYKFTGFGRIAHASITTAPLTILVGRNNTGKSYAATLLWAMCNFSGVVLNPRNLADFALPEWLTRYVNGALKTKRGRPIEIKGEQISRELNEWLRSSKNRVISKILSLDNAKIDSLELDISGSLWLRPWRRYPSAFKDFKSFGDRTTSSWMLSWNKDIDIADEEDLPAMLASIGSADNGDAAMLYMLIVQKFITKHAYNSFGNHIYIPAARTGLMLSLPSLVNSSIESFGVDDAATNQGKFTLPTIRFIQNIARGTNENLDREVPIVRFLEDNILHGKVSRDPETRTKFNYVPADGQVQLPLHATSSMVSELTPLITSLRNNTHSNGIVLEEPEAHLHLSAQRWMARAIVKLVNSGTPVTITTHSDTFMQQINLLIQLNRHPDRQSLMNKYDYQEDELLNIDHVRGYEFVSGKNGTNVIEVEKSSAGLIIQSLNDALYSIAEEVFAVESE